MVVKRVGPLSLAKITGVVYAAIGLIFGCLFGLVSLMGSAVSQQPPNPVFGVFLGAGAVIFLPLIYGGLGFLMSLLMAVLYNFVAGHVGGIELELESTPMSEGLGSGV